MIQEIYFCNSASHLKTSPSECDIECGFKKFNDGELGLKISLSVGEIKVVSSPKTSDDIIELCQTLRFFRESGSLVHLDLRYFPYARQDRSFDGEPNSARLIVDMIEVAGGSSLKSVTLFELHSPQIEGFFSVPTSHNSLSSDLYKDIIAKNNLQNPVIVAPDAGAVKRAGKVATDLGIGLTIVHKERTKPGEVKPLGIIGDVSGKDLIVADDIIDTGGTLFACAGQLKDLGANSVYAVIAHGVLSGSAKENLEKSVIQKLYISNSISHEERGKLCILKDMS